MSSGKEKKTKLNYRYFYEITTRWNDNDVRWHINNAKYYEFFDTVINKMLIELNSLSLKVGKNIFTNGFCLNVTQSPQILRSFKRRIACCGKNSVRVSF